MKTKCSILTALLLLVFHYGASSQSQEVQQLVLNVEKLSQFKNILSDMKTGYQVLSKGYNAVRDISKGSFSLHQTFLDGLLAVSPEVRKYRKVAEIISMQSQLVKEYKSAFRSFKQTDLFSEKELNYMSTVYGQLTSRSLKNLESLLSVVTAGELRMNDEERLEAIDRIFSDLEDKLLFLRNFNSKAYVVSRQRSAETSGISSMQQLYQTK
ncbi:MAG: TerB family tellurite resistance protein [Chitinophagaceae bacterium]|nr:MAG: TerB family tellurite resistance protein [Chitinophagaceae bacterium]